MAATQGLKSWREIQTGFGCVRLYDRNGVTEDGITENFVQFYVHPEQPPVYADQFDVTHDPLELLHVTVLLHVVNGGNCVHGLHPEQLRALISASRTTSCSC
jgi:hypothetical protein